MSKSSNPESPESELAPAASRGEPADQLPEGSSVMIPRPTVCTFGRWEASEVREAAGVYELGGEPAIGWPWEDALEPRSFTIRMPDPSGPARCSRCRVRFSAAGPTGHADDRPICDMCLLEGSSELGMVLALVAVVRAFGLVTPSGHESYREALAELGAFARIYERFAARSGPARVFRIPSFEVDP